MKYREGEAREGEGGGMSGTTGYGAQACFGNRNVDKPLVL